MSLKEKMSAVLKDIKKTSYDVSEASKEMFQDVRTQWEGSKMQDYWQKGLVELKAQYVKLREKAEEKIQTSTKTETLKTEDGKVETTTKVETKNTPKPPSNTPKPPLV